MRTPKGFLDNADSSLAVRHHLFQKYRVQAIINCHKDTFQPYTGSRGCLIVARKKERPNDNRRYRIFMAINRRVGQESEGRPVYRKDERGRRTSELDHDLDSILASWQAFMRGELEESEYVFSIDAQSLDPRTLKCNPQFFLPKLNQSLQRIMSLDGNGFTVKRLGEISMRIWKGTRWKREDLFVEYPASHTVEYLTPSSIFMGGEGAKHLDLSKSFGRRKEDILRHAAKEGEILITRSGTVGRIVIVGRNSLGKILSDDLIRVRIDDPELRALVFSFLRSPSGQDQLLRNEYGTVQQHLEPSHVADVQVPLRDDMDQLGALLGTVTSALEAHQKAVESAVTADNQFADPLRGD